MDHTCGPVIPSAARDPGAMPGCLALILSLSKDARDDRLIGLLRARRPGSCEIYASLVRGRPRLRPVRNRQRNREHRTAVWCGAWYGNASELPSALLVPPMQQDGKIILLDGRNSLKTQKSNCRTAQSFLEAGIILTKRQNHFTVCRENSGNTGMNLRHGKFTLVRPGTFYNTAGTFWGTAESCF